jgi:hypothetical protein
VKAEVFTQLYSRAPGAERARRHETASLVLTLTEIEARGYFGRDARSGFSCVCANHDEARLRRMKTNLLLLITALAGLAGTACQSGGIGDPCIPDREYSQGFSGYDVTGVYVESKSFTCQSRVCLVNHFTGRVSCPYGQAEHEQKCFIPGTPASASGNNVVNVPVPPQLVQRRPESAVYCSCRCDGPDKGLKYCE